MLTASPRGSTRRAAVLGSPISHSLSPALHQAAYRALGLGHWLYSAHEVKEPALRGFVAGLGPQWAGLSLTMPLKQVALEVAGQVSDLARQVGAVNTLVRAQDGAWRGENTDVYGVRQALREAGSALVESAVVLGSGATARAVVAALATLGCTHVTFAVRSGARQETLDQARRAGLEVDVVALADVGQRWGEVPVVVSTLPASSLVSEVLSHARPSRDHLLLDVVYAGWPTPLARRFQQAGASVVSGLEMLVHQGAQQVHLMTGLDPPVEVMRAAGLAAMTGTAATAGTTTASAGTTAAAAPS